jgi:hypothetical protein
MVVTFSYSGVPKESRSVRHTIFMGTSRIEESAKRGAITSRKSTLF